MKKYASKGFTLIELMVAVGLFAIIMVLSTGVYLMAVGVNRQVQASVTAIDSFAFVLETMTREIRTGTNYSCSDSGSAPPNCSGGGTTFSFMSADGQNIRYQYGPGTAIFRNDNVTNQSITDSSIIVTNLKFYVTGATPGDNYQPQVRISISGTTSGNPGQTLSFTIETMSTMRGIDL